MGLPAFGHMSNWDAYLRQHGAPAANYFPPLKKRPTKCDSCGSREFVEHRGERVCAYCRGSA